MSHQRGDRGHVGSDSLRQKLTRAGEPLLYELAGAVDVGAPLELDEDERERDVIDGAQAIHTGHAHQGGFHWNGDEGLDLLGGVAGGFDEDGHRRLSQVGQDLYR